MQYTTENYTSSYYTDVVIIFVDGEAPPGAATPILGGAEEIINTPLDVGASYIISAEEDMGLELEAEDSVTWSWELDEHTDAISFSPGTQSLGVTYTPDLDIFPVDALDYLEADMVTKIRLSGTGVWDDLPPVYEAPEIIYMKPRTPNFKLYIATVTATVTLAEGGTESSTSTFAVIIYANYSIMRDLMLEAIDARSI